MSERPDILGDRSPKEIRGEYRRFPSRYCPFGICGAVAGFFVYAAYRYATDSDMDPAFSIRSLAEGVYPPMRDFIEAGLTTLAGAAVGITFRNGIHFSRTS